MPRKAVYAGTFDPPTCGHQWMIEQASRMFDQVEVAIGINPEKRTMFPLDARLEMLRQISAALPNVQVTSFVNQYLIHYAMAVGAAFIVRGIRNGGDFEYERAMRNINGDISHEIATVFLMPPRDIAEVSSSVVKGLIGPRGWERMVSRYVGTPVLQRIMEAKHSAWQSLVALGARGNSAPFWSELWSAYFDPSRAYHNWQHICAMLADFYPLQATLRDPAAVELAIWYHDLVYDPRAGNNEQLSADAAIQRFRDLSVPPAFGQRVAQLILATKHHEASAADADAQTLIDLDLAVLGQSPDEYDRYESAIRSEYAWVPAEQFRQGRIAVLRGFLDRPRIYATDVFWVRYEALARENLRRAMKQLAQP